MRLDRNSSMPLYEQLKNIIQKKIETNEYTDKFQLPSEREFEQQYKVSRITVRQAITLAENEGLVKRVHGLGTFVNKRKIHSTLNTVNNFQSTIEEDGLIATTKLISSDIVANDFNLSKILNISMFENIYNMKLLGYGNNNPVVFYDTYFSISLGNEMAEIVKEFNNKDKPFSTLDLYNSHAQYTPTHTEQTIESVSVTKELENILKIDDTNTLLKITSVIYENDIPLEFKKAYYRGDQYKFFITRNI